MVTFGIGYVGECGWLCYEIFYPYSCNVRGKSCTNFIDTMITCADLLLFNIVPFGVLYIQHWF